MGPARGTMNASMSSRGRRPYGFLAVASACAITACSLVTDLSGFSEPVASPDAAGPANAPDAVAAGSDAGSDAASSDRDSSGAPPPCVLTAPFGAASLVPDVNSGASERTATLTADELLLCLESGRPSGTGSDDIWCGTRASRTDGFVMSNLTSVNTPSADFSPTLTPDGLVIFFASDRGGPTLQVYSASRAQRTAPFGTASPVPALAGSSDQADTSVVGGNIYFDSDKSGNFDIFVSTGGAAPVSLDSVNTAAGEYTPVVSADELALYFNRGGLDGDIYVARRTSTAHSFGAPTAVTELNTTFGEWPHWMSPDGCRLYFGSNRPGGVGTSTSVWMAERSPASP